MRALLAAAAVLALVGCTAAEAPAPAADGSSAAQSFALAPTNISAFFDCVARENGTLVSAHRGGPSPGYAENALETFAHTLTLAPASLEADVSVTRDGVLVLMHDETLERTTTGRGPVSEISLAEFAALQLRDNEGTVLDAHPPTLAQALEWADGKTILDLDIKRNVRFEDVVAAVRAANAQNRVVIVTYSDGAAMRLHRLAPELMMYVTIENDAQAARLARGGVDLTRVIAWTGVTEPNSELNVALAQRGVESRFGTLGRPDQSWDARFAREGEEGYAAFAETGLEQIATDRPSEAYRALDAADGEGYAPLRCLAAN